MQMSYFCEPNGVTPLSFSIRFIILSTAFSEGRHQQICPWRMYQICNALLRTKTKYSTNMFLLNSKQGISCQNLFFSYINIFFLPFFFETHITVISPENCFSSHQIIDSLNVVVFHHASQSIMNCKPKFFFPFS